MPKVRFNSKNRWDLFIFLHTLPQYRSNYLLDPIPEEVYNNHSNESQHKCNDSLFQSSQSINQLRSHSSQEKIKDSDGYESFESLSKREKNRKQWKTSADNIQNICESYSKLDIESESDKRSCKAEHNRRHSRSRRSDFQLPPLQRNSSSKKKTDKKSDQINIEAKDIEKYSTNGEANKQSETLVNIQKSNHQTYQTGDNLKMEQNLKSNKESSSELGWIVRKPEKIKPQDHLKPEGKMDLETTFKSTIGSSAEQRMLFGVDNYRSNVASRVSKTENQIQGVDQSQLNISIPTSKKGYRPQTSLKLGGEGYFHTLNQDTYKNFVVIDQKKKSEANLASKHKIKTNLKNEIKSQSKSLKNEEKNLIQNVNLKSQNVDQKQKEVEIDKKNNIKLPKVSNRYEKTQKTNHAVDYETNSSNDIIETRNSVENSKINKESEQGQRKLKINNTRSNILETQDTGINNQVRRTPIRPTSSLTVSGKFKGDQKEKVLSQKRHYEHVNEDNKSDNVENIINSNQSENKMISNSTVDFKWNSKTEENQSSSLAYKRSQSLPRTRVCRHKNDSQLKFDGQMDFVTTSNQFFKNLENKQSISKQAVETTRNKTRNLFRTSSEVDFNSKSTFDQSTTYNDQFKNQLYCPAIDLGTARSDFEYKGEAGGHQFYHQCIHY